MLTGEQGRDLFATTTDGAHPSSPFHVVAAVQGITRIGALSGQLEAKARSAVEDLNRAAPQLLVSDNILEDIWHKLLVSAVINPLTAKYRCLNGQLPSKADSDIIALCEESCAIAQACNRDFDAAFLRQIVIEVCEKTANNTSSMLADILAERRTEIGEINGYLVQQALARGIPAPINSGLVESFS